MKGCVTLVISVCRGTFFVTHTHTPFISASPSKGSARFPAKRSRDRNEVAIFKRPKNDGVVITRPEETKRRRACRTKCPTDLRRGLLRAAAPRPLMPLVWLHGYTPDRICPRPGLCFESGDSLFPSRVDMDMWQLGCCCSNLLEVTLGRSLCVFAKYHQ